MKIILLLSLFLVSAYAQDQKGLTWGVKLTKKPGGYVNVHCHGKPETVESERSPSCDPYVGDTSCQEIRPVLCINKEKKISRPAGIVTDAYNEWAAGEVQLTQPIEGFQLRSLEAANSLCQEYFGRGWRMAEFHDGWGWGFWAEGKISNSERFWVYINDQNANCWNGPSPGSLKKEQRRPMIMIPSQLF